MEGHVGSWEMKGQRKNSHAVGGVGEGVRGSGVKPDYGGLASQTGSVTLKIPKKRHR